MPHNHTRDKLRQLAVGTTAKENNLKYFVNHNPIPLGEELVKALLSENGSKPAINDDMYDLRFNVLSSTDRTHTHAVVATFKKWDDGNNSTWWKFERLTVDEPPETILMSGLNNFFVFKYGEETVEAVANAEEFMWEMQSWVNAQDISEQWRLSMHGMRDTDPLGYWMVHKRNKRINLRVANMWLKAFHEVYERRNKADTAM